MKPIEKFAARMMLMAALISAPLAMGSESSLSQDLANLLDSEISHFQEALEKEAGGGLKLASVHTSSSQTEDGYFLRRFWLRVRPYVDIEVPGFAGFEVIPEVEMLWEKNTPEGWEIYRP
jgi:hypothetical protein